MSADEALMVNPGDAYHRAIARSVERARAQVDRVERACWKVSDALRPDAKLQTLTIADPEVVNWLERSARSARVAAQSFALAMLAPDWALSVVAQAHRQAVQEAAARSHTRRRRFSLGCLIGLAVVVVLVVLTPVAIHWAFWFALQGLQP